MRLMSILMHFILASLAGLITSKKEENKESKPIIYITNDHNPNETKSSINQQIESSVLDEDLFLSFSTDVDIFSCKANTCMDDRVKCNKERTKCICTQSYATINNGLYCNYERRSQQTAFLIELLLGFGGGHFYANRFLFGGLKLGAFIVGIFFIFFFNSATCYLNKECNWDISLIFVSILMYGYSMGMATWYVFDAVYFGKNYYLDGYNIPLLIW